MSDLKDLIVAASDVRRKEKDFLLATVVRARGSSYCRPGTRILLSDNRWTTGAVSGGGIARVLARRGFWHTRENAPELVTYDSRGNDDVGWGLGLGCSGVLEILLERIGPRTLLDPLAFIERCVRDQVRGSLATVFRTNSSSGVVGARLCVVGDGFAESSELTGELHRRLLQDCHRAIASGRSAVHSYQEGVGSVDVLVEAIVPPPRLFLFGGGHDASSRLGGRTCRVTRTTAAVANLARAVGWDVFVCIPHASAETYERFGPADAVVLTSAPDIRVLIRESDRALAVVMSNDDQHDKQAFMLSIRSAARYIGVLGARDRTAKIAEELGIDIDCDPRIHAPVGLAMGAATPEQIALAIVADAQSVLSTEQTALTEDVETPPSRRVFRARDQHAHASPT